jgi:hypothetical protein
MARKNQDEFTIGQDSFLDTVANLVGILIIVVVIVGAQSQKMADKQSEQEIAKVGLKGLQQPLIHAKQIEQDLHRQQVQLKQHALEVSYRKAERDAILDQLHVARIALEEAKQQLDEPAQEALEQHSELSDLEKKLAELLADQVDEGPRDPDVIALQHLPTPMAKTVFHQEIHVLLSENRLSVIPWERLVESLKREAELAIRRSTRKENIDGQLGPIGGFLMDYKLVAKRGVVSNGSAMGMGQMVELDRFELQPTHELVRQSLDQAFQSGGSMRLELAGRRPQETVVTVWVYPDSFVTFRQLKETLFEQGFMTAARPLPFGVRIGASPHGTQSDAQ